jgi:hypothetical protein
MFRKLYQSLRPFVASKKNYSTLTREAIQHYPNSISAQEVNRLLEETYQSQSYTLNMVRNLFGSQKSDAALLEKYPNEVGHDEIEKTLAEAEATRNKFSKY